MYKEIKLVPLVSEKLISVSLKSAVPAWIWLILDIDGNKTF
jgi:hypothetical protein